MTFTEIIYDSNFITYSTTMIMLWGCFYYLWNTYKPSDEDDDDNDTETTSNEVVEVLNDIRDLLITKDEEEEDKNEEEDDDELGVFDFWYGNNRRSSITNTYLQEDENIDLYMYQQSRQVYFSPKIEFSYNNKWHHVEKITWSFTVGDFVPINQRQSNTIAVRVHLPCFRTGIYYIAFVNMNNNDDSILPLPVVRINGKNIDTSTWFFCEKTYEPVFIEVYMCSDFKMIFYPTMISSSSSSSKSLRK